MKKKKDKEHLDDYLQELKEWQDHQYNAGHYLGGKIPPTIKRGNRKLLFYWLAIPVILVFLFYLILFFFPGHFSFG